MTRRSQPNPGASHSASASAAKYRAPALERGLAILELLASHAEGLTQNRIAGALGNAVSENFRMLEVLLRCGFVEKTPARDAFRLTPKLFVMGQQFPPVQRLLDAALPRMRALSALVGQSCHLAVGTHRRFLVLANVESSQPISFTVRPGGMWPYEEGVSGRTLLAFRRPEIYEAWKERMQAEGEAIDWAVLEPALARIRQRGYEEAESRFVTGITDIAAPIRDPRGEALAALCLPYVSFRSASHTREQARRELLLAAGELQTTLGAASKPFAT